MLVNDACKNVEFYCPFKERKKYLFERWSDSSRRRRKHVFWLLRSYGSQFLRHLRNQIWMHRTWLVNCLNEGKMFQANEKQSQTQICNLTRWEIHNQFHLEVNLKNDFGIYVKMYLNILTMLHFWAKWQ